MSTLLPRWTYVLGLITGLFVGLGGGWMANGYTTQNRYLRALAEKHEAVTRYWDIKTNDIITNNTLERNKRDAKQH